MRRHAPLAAILTVVFLARAWGLGFGLPSVSCRPDEDAVVAVALWTFGRHLNPHFFDWPPLFMYVVATCLVPYFLVGRHFGWFHTEYHFIHVMAANVTPVVLVARSLSVAAGVASVWVVHRTGRRMFDETTGLVAAAFLALAFLHARDSHFGVTDVAATFMVLTCFLYVVRFAQSGSRRDLVAGGARRRGRQPHGHAETGGSVRIVIEP